MQLSRSHSGTAGPRQPQRMPQAHSLLLSCRSRCAPALTRTNPARLITRAASPDTLDQAAVSERQQSAKNASSSKGADDFHDWRQHITEVMQGLADADSAVTLTCKGKISAAQEWRQVIVRPVDLKAGRQLQFSYFGAKQNIVKNAPLASDDAITRMYQLLHELPWSGVSLKSATEVYSVQLTKSGKAIVHRTPLQPSTPDTTNGSPTSDNGSGRLMGNTSAAEATGPIRLTHDRRKDLPIPPDVPHAFLQRIGMQTAEGRLKADMADKMAQVNDFLKLLRHTGALTELQSALQGRPLTILDCGCGSSHLTFGTWHYLNNVLGMSTHIRGVDSNTGLMERSNTYSRDLGLTPEQALFTAAHIAAYQPDVPPHVVLALHACDTATDEALALAVKQRAPLILAVPCCHQHLHKQLAGARGNAISPLQPIMTQGISRQRLLDIVTDTLRAQLLRVLGYKTDVVEFVSTEHTPRNTLIRAVLPRPWPTVDMATHATRDMGDMEAPSTGAHASDMEATSTPHANNGDNLAWQRAQSEALTRSSSRSKGAVKGQGGAEAAGGRSRRAGASLQEQAWSEYVALKAFFGGVTPKLETLLSDELRACGLLAD